MVLVKGKNECLVPCFPYEFVQMPSWILFSEDKTNKKKSHLKTSPLAVFQGDSIQLCFLRL